MMSNTSMVNVIIDFIIEHAKSAVEYNKDQGHVFIIKNMTQSTWDKAKKEVNKDGIIIKPGELIITPSLIRRLVIFKIDVKEYLLEVNGHNCFSNKLDISDPSFFDNLQSIIDNIGIDP